MSRPSPRDLRGDRRVEGGGLEAHLGRGGDDLFRLLAEHAAHGVDDAAAGSDEGGDAREDRALQLRERRRDPSPCAAGGARAPADGPRPGARRVDEDAIVGPSAPPVPAAQSTAKVRAAPGRYARARLASRSASPDAGRPRRPRRSQRRRARGARSCCRGPRMRRARSRRRARRAPARRPASPPPARSTRPPPSPELGEPTRRRARRSRAARRARLDGRLGTRLAKPRDPRVALGRVLDAQAERRRLLRASSAAPPASPIARTIAFASSGSAASSAARASSSGAGFGSPASLRSTAFTKPATRGPRSALTV